MSESLLDAFPGELREIDGHEDPNKTVSVLWGRDNGQDRVFLSVVSRSGNYDDTAVVEIDPANVLGVEAHVYPVVASELGHIAAAKALGLFAESENATVAA